MSRILKCRKCNIKPDVMQSAMVTTIKCPKCGQAESAFMGKQKAVSAWNKENAKREGQ